MRYYAKRPLLGDKCDGGGEHALPHCKEARASPVRTTGQSMTLSRLSRIY